MSPTRDYHQEKPPESTEGVVLGRAEGADYHDVAEVVTAPGPATDETHSATEGMEGSTLVGRNDVAAVNPTPQLTGVDEDGGEGTSEYGADTGPVEGPADGIAEAL